MIRSSRGDVDFVRVNVVGGSRERVVTGDACLALFAPIYEFSRSPISPRSPAPQRRPGARVGMGSATAGVGAEKRERRVSRVRGICVLRVVMCGRTGRLLLGRPFSRDSKKCGAASEGRRAFYPSSLIDQASSLYHAPRVFSRL